MLLHRKLMFTTLLLFGLLYGLVTVTQLSYSRAYFAERLHAELVDQAQLIASVAQPLLAANEITALEAVIAQWPVEAYGLLIQLEVVPQGRLLERAASVEESVVPAWFVEQVRLPTDEIQREIRVGQQVRAKLYIAGDTASAYLGLWRLNFRILLWFGLSAALVLLLMLFVTRRLTLPLRQLEQQVDALSFPRVGAPMPETGIVELRGVIHSFNTMSQRLQKQFSRQVDETEALRRAAYQDALTGLGNRLFFRSELEQWLAKPGSGGLMLIHLYHLERVANEQGYQRRDQLITEVSEQLRDMRRGYGFLIPARLSEDEFVLLVSASDSEQFMAMMQELDRRLNRATWGFGSGLGSLYSIGATERLEQLKSGDLMARADAALQQAHLNNSVRYQLQSEGANRPVLGRSTWRKLVLSALSEQNLRFQLQPVMAMSGKVISLELFSSIEHQGVVYHAAQFMPFVEQYQLGATYDRHLLQQIAPHVVTRGVPLVVNLSESAMADVAFVSWLEQWLENDTLLRKLIGFELPESALIDLGGGLETVTTIFRRLEVRFGFDRIGRHLDELRRLVELGPNYLKIDRSLVLCPPEEDKGFLKSLARLAHDQDAELIVVRIEDQEQLHALQDKSVDGYQGYIRPAVKWKLGH